MFEKLALVIEGPIAVTVITLGCFENSESFGLSKFPAPFTKTIFLDKSESKSDMKGLLCHESHMFVSIFIHCFPYLR